MVRAASGRRSSVVERTLGKGEVDSSILSGGTSDMAEFRRSPASTMARTTPRTGGTTARPRMGPYCGMTAGGPPPGGVRMIGARGAGGVTGGRMGGTTPPEAAVTRNGATA